MIRTEADVLNEYHRLEKILQRTDISEDDRLETRGAFQAISWMMTIHAMEPSKVFEIGKPKSE